MNAPGTISYNYVSERTTRGTVQNRTVSKRIDTATFVSENGGRRKERKKSLAREHVKDVGSAEGIQSYKGQGYEGAIAGKCLCDFPVPPSLRDGCALRGAGRARPMSVRGAPLLMGGLMMRWG